MTTMISYRNGHGRVPTLLGWDPARIFAQLASWEPAGGRTVWSAVASPIKLEEHEDGVTAALDMPGVDPENVELVFEAGTLSICGRRGERAYRYTLHLGDAIDPDTIAAELDKGVLVVNARKRPELKPRKILLKGAEPRRITGGEGGGEGGEGGGGESR